MNPEASYFTVDDGNPHGVARPHSARRVPPTPRVGRRDAGMPAQEATMLLALAIILAVAWLVGLLAFHVTAFAFHILILIAVIALIAHVIGWARGSRSATVP